MDRLVWTAGQRGGSRTQGLDPAGLMDLAWFWQAFLNTGCHVNSDAPATLSRDETTSKIWNDCGRTPAHSARHQVRQQDGSVPPHFLNSGNQNENDGSNRAPGPKRTSRLECVWKQDPLFQSAREDGAADPHPAGRSPFARVCPPKKNPSGGFSPPVPQGSGAGIPGPREDKPNSFNTNTQRNHVEVNFNF